MEVVQAQGLPFRLGGLHQGPADLHAEMVAAPVLLRQGEQEAAAAQPMSRWRGRAGSANSASRGGSGRGCWCSRLSGLTCWRTIRRLRPTATLPARPGWGWAPGSRGWRCSRAGGWCPPPVRSRRCRRPLRSAPRKGGPQRLTSPSGRPVEALAAAQAGEHQGRQGVRLPLGLVAQQLAQLLAGGGGIPQLELHLLPHPHPFGHGHGAIAGIHSDQVAHQEGRRLLIPPVFRLKLLRPTPEEEGVLHQLPLLRSGP